MNLWNMTSGADGCLSVRKDKETSISSFQWAKWHISILCWLTSSPKPKYINVKVYLTDKTVTLPYCWRWIFFNVLPFLPHFHFCPEIKTFQKMCFRSCEAVLDHDFQPIVRSFGELVVWSATSRPVSVSWRRRPEPHQCVHDPVRGTLWTASHIYI